jgi:hypothetical protein
VSSWEHLEWTLNDERIVIIITLFSPYLGKFSIISIGWSLEKRWETDGKTLPWLRIKNCLPLAFITQVVILVQVVLYIEVCAIYLYLFCLSGLCQAYQGKNSS